MKQRLLFFLLTLLPILASAETVEINGISYNLISKAKEAEVIKSAKYSGSIVVPSSVVYSGVTYKVTSIGERAFSYNDNITSVSISDGVTTIGDAACAFSTNIQSIILPKTILSIGDAAFRQCAIKTINLPNSIQSIGDHALAECNNLTSVELPRSNPNYGYGLFGDCRNLTNVVIPEGKKSIEQAMFYGCISLKTVNIPNSVESIGYGAFQYCTGFTEFTIPNGVKEIKQEAFSDCKNIKVFTIGSGVSKIDYNAFSYCEDLTDVICYANNPPNTHTTAFDNSFPQYITLHVPTASLQKYREATPWNKFGSIKEINNDPLNDPKESYRNININGIYYNLIGKAQVAEVLPSKTYSGDIVVPGSVVYSGVTYKVTTIGERAFSSNDNITSVSVSDGVTSIGDAAFGYSSNIRSIDLPNTILSIGNYAFAFSAIETINLSNSIQSIGHHAFQSCNNLTSVVLPGINSFYDYAIFLDCKNLVNVTIPEGRTSIEQAMFSGCTSLKSIKIPNSVESFGAAAFADCTGFTEFVIPNGVKVIKGEAFSGCKNIKVFTIGSGVSKIDYNAFSYCEDLTDVICYANNPPNTHTTAFDNSFPQYITLHVPGGAIQKYKVKEPWKNFKEIVKIDMPKHTLIYKVDGEVYKTYSIEEGDNITPEPAPTKEGYTFSGWSEIPQTMPAKDVTVTGTFSINKYKLTYMVDGKLYKQYEVDYGAKITPEPAPTKDGYSFSGWSNIPSTMPAKDVTIIGSFFINKYKLTYIVDGEVYKSYEIEYGAKITPETAPIKEGYSFSGWSEIPSTMPAKDVTVTGTFSRGSYTLTYVVDGITYKTVSYDYGETITPEANPTKEGYTFSGWSNIPITMPANNITVTGSFTINKYKLIYKVDGEIYKTYEIEYGATITPEAEPTKDGYKFSGWSWIPSKMPAEDVVVTGYFTFDGVVKDNVSYTIDGDKASVTKTDNANGEIKIESSVIINGQTYLVTMIAEGAFQGCTGITSVEIPNTITTIGQNAFNGCSGLLVIKIGNGVKEIGSKAFANIATNSVTTRAEDTSLKVYCEAEVLPSTAADAFENSPIGRGTLYVNDGLVSVYKVVMPWNGFCSIVGLSTGINSVTIDTENSHIYDIQGNRLDDVRKGVNIIRSKDGKAKKVMVK